MHGFYHCDDYLVEKIGEKGNKNQTIPPCFQQSGSLRDKQQTLSTKQIKQ